MPLSKISKIFTILKNSEELRRTWKKFRRINLQELKIWTNSKEFTRNEKKLEEARRIDKNLALRSYMCNILEKLRGV